MAPLTCIFNFVFLAVYFSACIAATRDYLKPANREKRFAFLKHGMFIFVLTVVTVFSLNTFNSGPESKLVQMLEALLGK
ncbi:hypothetical protein A2619_02995 [candidate division WWE3 bacterium RIFOXYD1_FULL_39_9]|uniref:Uncharacterized protein n=1 Tax=candidate division WWE3 bacterium RIFOXYD1_FULL_39_9 TaxID=1802649 RepID=A0A1F4X8J4_UNCKA|nr:MAG: hypothetical protein A2619_02995 [candidate division WWE3 bacterium RIFOXYD1_FULL_39_9]